MANAQKLINESNSKESAPAEDFIERKQVRVIRPSFLRNASRTVKGATGRVNSLGTRAVGALASFRQQQYNFPRQIARNPYATTGKSRGVKSGRGRPRGSYDPRYAKFGGVYGYRRILTAQLRSQRLQNLRDATINPQQQMILNQIEARNQAQRLNPENRTVPDTSGKVPLRSIQNEIYDAAHIIP